MKTNRLREIIVRHLLGSKTSFATFAALVMLSGCATTPSEKGFVSIFDGKSLDGWSYIGKPGEEYYVTNGVLICPKEGHNNLVTDKEYSDFILRFDYKYYPDGNNGVAIRVPYSTENLTYVGVELQLLDDIAPMHKNIKPWQHNGSVYGLAASTNSEGIIGEWNSEEVTCIGRHYKVVLNGRTLVDADLNKVHDPELLRTHPGFLRDRGRIGWLGHESKFEFRNIRIKELPVKERDNKPPKGFVALFNGKDLTGWKGLVEGPPARAKMSPEKLAAAQAKADENMRKHWKVENGEIVFDGKGENLCTSKDYGDFEMLV
ncbi:MAG: hypothetical protein JWQ04_3293, partial [Pedosphaera sp.]|nr:hypothetical protein [Pedosphaera sp.]